MFAARMIPPGVLSSRGCTSHGWRGLSATAWRLGPRGPAVVHWVPPPSMAGPSSSPLRWSRSFEFLLPRRTSRGHASLVLLDTRVKGVLGDSISDCSVPNKAQAVCVCWPWWPQTPGSQLLSIFRVGWKRSSRQHGWQALGRDPGVGRRYVADGDTKVSFGPCDLPLFVPAFVLFVGGGKHAD